MGKGFKRFIAAVLAGMLALPGGLGAPVARAAESSGPETVYHETFSAGKGAAAQSGGANLKAVTGKAFDGNTDGAALYVSNRSNNWDAADFKFADIGLQNGKTYTVTVSVYVDASEVVPAGAQAYLQAVNSYALLAGADYASGKAITLSKEFTVDTSADSALRVQSNDAGAAVPFYIGEITIVRKNTDGGNGENPKPPAEAFRTVTFEDQTTEGFYPRGGTETLTVTNEANHTEGGSYALKVEGRTETWHAPALRVEKYVDKGFEYKVSAWVKLIEPSSSQLQLSTQVGDGSSASYVSLSSKTISAQEGWVLLEGTYRYNNIESGYMTIYVESSSNSTASFYVDDISFQRTDAAPVTIEKDILPLKTKYANHFLIGNAISAEDLAGVRLDLLKMHHNTATAGNAMKPDALQSQKGQFTFGAADAMVDKVRAEGMKMHGHVLVWHQQSPSWMFSTPDGQPLPRTEALANMRAHIRAVVEHFGDRVISWDVVNEAMGDNPPNPADWQDSLRKSLWYQSIGPDFVEQAFLAAREVLDEHSEWNVKLYYNDYNEDNQNKSKAIANMTKEINDRYALTHPGKRLIDGLGMQGHYNVNTNPENVKLTLDRFISLGTEVSITELDIQAGSDYQLSEKLANAQGYLYAQLFQLFQSRSEHIARVTMWGLDDGTSWRASNNPLLFDKNLKSKPAYQGAINPEAFIEAHKPDTSHANQSKAKYATPVIDGVMDETWKSAPEMAVNRFQMAWQGATAVGRALWDEGHLYVLMQVSDDQLDKTSANPWEQDSVEIFVDANNGKTTFYQEDDGQYRINFDNEVSFSSTSISEGFQSAVKVSGNSYIVEAKIPLPNVKWVNGTKLGFDMQVNDAKNGARQSAAAWNDTAGTAYMDTSVFGVLTLEGKPDGSGGSGGGSWGSDSDNSSPGYEIKDGILKLKLQTSNGLATSILTFDALNKALEQARTPAGSKKQLTVELPAQDGIKTYEVQLPVRGLKDLQDGTLTLRTELGTLSLPVQPLLQTAAKETLDLRIARSTTEGLAAGAIAQVGSRPVLEISLQVDGKAVAWPLPSDGKGAKSLRNHPDAITVTIPYKLPEDKSVSAEQLVVWSLNAKGAAVPVVNSRYDAAAQAMVFKVTALGKYAIAAAPVSAAPQGFSGPAAQAAYALKIRGVFDSAEEQVTRADFVASLLRILEIPVPEAAGASPGSAFQDISVNSTYYHLLVKAKDLGIVEGYEDGTFRPAHPLSRQDMMALTARALTAGGFSSPRLSSAPASGSAADAALASYPDAASLSAYARNGAAALAELGVISGRSGMLAPHDNLTAEEAVLVLYRIWGL